MIAMTAPESNGAENPGELPPEELGRSYEAVMEQQEWASDQAPPTSTFAAPPEPEAPPPPMRIVEAMLFVGGAPLTATRAGEVVRGLTPEQFHQAIDALNRDYRRQARPYTIRAEGAGFVLALHYRYRGVMERLYGGPREAQLSQAAVDVLSLVAYRQPATKQEIDGLRGAESGALLRQLVRRGLIAVSQRGQAGQRDVTYATTPRFLELFSLTNLDDLPRTQDLRQV
jgi:segregation and condensation protein B